MKNLKKLRTEHHMSQQQLAEHLYVTQQSIWKYENGQAHPDLDILKRMADFFGVSIDYLVGRTDIPYPAALPPKQCAGIALPDPFSAGAFRPHIGVNAQAGARMNSAHSPQDSAQTAEQPKSGVQAADARLLSAFRALDQTAQSALLHFLEALSRKD